MADLYDLRESDIHLLIKHYADDFSRRVGDLGVDGIELYLGCFARLVASLKDIERQNYQIKKLNMKRELERDD